MIEFIFMLTRNDQTVPDAMAVYDQVRDSDLRLIGFKDIGLPPAQLRELAAAMRADGREVFLEVVSERAEDELPVRQRRPRHRRRLAARRDPPRRGPVHPRPGRATGHAGPAAATARSRAASSAIPSVLTGTLEEITDSARALTARPGVDGLDLLAYRWDGDVPALTRSVVDACSAARSSRPAASTPPSASATWPPPGRGRSPSAAPSSTTACRSRTPCAPRSTTPSSSLGRRRERRWSLTAPRRDHGEHCDHPHGRPIGRHDPITEEER